MPGNLARHLVHGGEPRTGRPGTGWLPEERAPLLWAVRQPRKMAAHGTLKSRPWMEPEAGFSTFCRFQAFLNSRRV